jgi:DNA-binding FadR family transcriptional regulator
MTKTSLTRLKPVVTHTQVDQIEMILNDYLRKGNFQPGDALPKEAELAKAMGVSRTAIREALSRFRTLGIIESKKNRGMVIRQPDVFTNMHRVLDAQLLDDTTMQEIFELRLVLEMGIAEHLFLRRSETGLKKLESIVQREETASDITQRLQLDVEFHSMLYEISSNHTILRFQQLLLPIFKYVADGIHVPRQVENSEFVSHRVLLDVLKNGTPEEFRVNMRKHLMNYFAIIK